MVAREGWGCTRLFPRTCKGILENQNEEDSLLSSYLTSMSDWFIFSMGKASDVVSAVNVQKIFLSEKEVSEVALRHGSEAYEDRTLYCCISPKIT